MIERRQNLRSHMLDQLEKIVKTNKLKTMLLKTHDLLPEICKATVYLRQ